MDSLPAHLPLTAALVWIASRNVERTRAALRLHGEIATAAAVMSAERNADDPYLVRGASADNPVRDGTTGDPLIQQDRAEALVAETGLFNDAAAEFAEVPETGKRILIVKRGRRTSNRLTDALARGQLGAFGDPGRGHSDPIPSWEWNWLKILPGNQARGAGGVAHWRHVTVDRAGLLKVFPALGAAAVQHASRTRIIAEMFEPRGIGRPGNKGRDAVKLARERKEGGRALSRAQERRWLEAEAGISKSMANTVLLTVYGPAKKSAKKSAEQ